MLRPTTRGAGAGVLAGRPGGLRRRPGAARTGPRDRRRAAATRSSGLRLVEHEALPAGAGPARRAGRRLGRHRQPGPRRPAARRGRPVGLRDHGGPLRRRGAVGRAAHRRAARHRGGGRAGPGAAGGAHAEVGRRPRGHDAPRAGLAAARLFVVGERPLVGGRLPDAEIGPLRDWLHGLAVDREQRDAVVRQTLAGALDSLDGRVLDLRAAVEDQEGRPHTLVDRRRTRPTAPRARRSTPRGRRRRCCAGRCWPAGRSSSAPASGCAACRRRSAGCGTGSARPSPGGRRSPDERAAVDRVQRGRAAGRRRRLRRGADGDRWRSLPGGAALLAGRERDLEAASPGFDDAAVDEVRDWQGHVLEPRARGGRRQADPGPLDVLGRQRRGRGGHGRRLRLHRRAARRRGGGRRRDDGGGPAGARGGLRRRRRPLAGRAGPRGPRGAGRPAAPRGAGSVSPT